MSWGVSGYISGLGLDDPMKYAVCYAGTPYFMTSKVEDAKWLADLFNRLGTVPPSERK